MNKRKTRWNLLKYNEDQIDTNYIWWVLQEFHCKTIFEETELTTVEVPNGSLWYVNYISYSYYTFSPRLPTIQMSLPIVSFIAAEVRDMVQLLNSKKGRQNK